MDNPTFPPPRGSSPQPGAPTRIKFMPDRRFTAAGAVGALVAIVVALLTDDPAGRLLVVVAALVLIAYVVGDIVFSPRLEASTDGIVIRSPFTRAVLGWNEIDSVQVVSRLRLGLRNTALELDAGATLAEFSRRSLGADPQQACDLVLAFRPT